MHTSLSLSLYTYIYIYINKKDCRGAASCGTVGAAASSAGVRYRWRGV